MHIIKIEEISILTTVAFSEKPGNVWNVIAKHLYTLLTCNYYADCNILLFVIF
jgi:hypothetical protein